MGIKELMGLGADEKIQKIRDEAPKFEEVKWYQDAGMKKLTMYSVVLCASSMGTGWDG